MNSQPLSGDGQGRAPVPGGKVVGMVGGLGPEATIEYYRLFIDRYRERRPDAYPPLLIESLDVDCALRLVTAGSRQQVAEYILASIRRLARGGAEIGLISANTPHIAFDEIEAGSPIPLISIVQATAARAHEMGLARLGLIGSSFTMQAGFYQREFARRGMEIITPEPVDLAFVHRVYVTELVKGRFLPGTRNALLAIIRRMMDAHAISGLVLGGTELPIMFRDNGGLGIPFLDTARIHVDAALDAMLE